MPLGKWLLSCALVELEVGAGWYTWYEPTIYYLPGHDMIHYTYVRAVSSGAWGVAQRRWGGGRKGTGEEEA